MYKWIVPTSQPLIIFARMVSDRRIQPQFHMLMSLNMALLASGARQLNLSRVSSGC